MRDRRRQQRGIALISTLFIIVILAILVAAVVLTSQMAGAIENENTSDAGAYGVAEAGLATSIIAVNDGTFTGNGWHSSIGAAMKGQTANSNVSYDDHFYINQTASTVDVVDPSQSAGGPCNSSPNANNDPGPGCVAVPPFGSFVAVTGYYYGSSKQVEALSLSHTVTTANNTITDFGSAPSHNQNGGGSIYADPGGAANDVNIVSNGNWTVSGNGTVAGNVTTVGGTNQASVCPTCTVTANNSGAYVNPPATNNLAQAKAQWISQAQADSCYYSSSISTGFTINPGEVCYLTQSSLNLKSLSTPLINNGGTLIVAGNVSETGNGANSNYQLESGATCATRGASWLVVLGTSGVSMHGVGSNGGNVVSQGVIFVPNGPYVEVGNGAAQAAVIAQYTQIGGSASYYADHCTVDATKSLPGYNMTAYGSV